MQRMLANIFYGLWLCSAISVEAAQATVAVATNFKTAAEQLAAAFNASHPHQITLVSGSTGKLNTQISLGAPFDLFLAADRERPAQLIASGLAVPGTLHTYAVGQLALLGQAHVDENTLSGDNFRSLAIANPALAPYGRAAIEVLTHLNLTEKVRHKIVRGQNVGQAYMLISSGNASIGLIASTLLQPEDQPYSWLIPSHYHTPVEQALVMLKRGAKNAAASDFLAFIHSQRGSDMIRDFGYLAPAS